MTDVAHLLSPLEADWICFHLRQLPKPIDVIIHICDRQVHVYPQRHVDSREEVAILGPVIGITDARIFWHRWEEAA